MRIRILKRVATISDTRIGHGRVLIGITRMNPSGKEVNNPDGREASLLATYHIIKDLKTSIPSHRPQYIENPFAARYRPCETSML